MTRVGAILLALALSSMANSAEAQSSREETQELSRCIMAVKSYVTRNATSDVVNANILRTGNAHASNDAVWKAQRAIMAEVLASSSALTIAGEGACKAEHVGIARSALQEWHRRQEAACDAGKRAKSLEEALTAIRDVGSCTPGRP